MYILNLTGYILDGESIRFAESLHEHVVAQESHSVKEYRLGGGYIFFGVHSGRRMGNQSGHAVVVAFQSEKHNHPIAGGYSSNGCKHPEMEGAPGQQYGIKFRDGRIHRRPQNECHERKIAFGNICQNWVWEDKLLPA